MFLFLSKITALEVACIIIFVFSHDATTSNAVEILTSSTRDGSNDIEPKLTFLRVPITSSNVVKKRGRCGSGPPSVMMMSNKPLDKQGDDAQARQVQRFLTTTHRLLQHFPWVAKIDVGLSTLQRRTCAAALIGPTTAVTAARCFYGRQDGVSSNPSSTTQALTRRSQITFFVDELPSTRGLRISNDQTSSAVRRSFTVAQKQMKGGVDSTPVLSALVQHDPATGSLDNYTLLTRPLRDVFIHPTANLALVRFSLPLAARKSGRELQFLCLARNTTANSTVMKSAHDSPWLAASNFFVSLMPSAPVEKLQAVQEEINSDQTTAFVDTWPYRPPLLFKGTETMSSNKPFVNFDSQLAFRLVSTTPYALLEPMGDIQCSLVMAIATGAPPTRYLRDKKCFTNAAMGEIDMSSSSKQQKSTTTMLQPRLCADVDIGVPLVKLVDGAWTLFGILSETVKCPSAAVANAVPQLPGVVQVSEVQFIRDELKPTLFTDLKHYRRWIEDQMRN